MFDWLQLVMKEISLDVKCIRLDNSGENLFIKKFKDQTTTSNLKLLHLAHRNKMVKLNVHLQHFRVKLDLRSTQLD
jgi:hypothetical protein